MNKSTTIVENLIMRNKDMLNYNNKDIRELLEQKRQHVKGIKVTISPSTTYHLDQKGLLTLHCPIDDAITFMSTVSDNENINTIKVISNESRVSFLNNEDLHDRYMQLINNIAKVKELQRLDLSSVNLGEFPKALRNLTELKYLNVDNTNLSVIPYWISEFTSLEELYIGNIHLHHIPKELCELSNLRVLSLKRSRIDDLPKEIGCLDKLEELYIRGFQLKEIPTTIGHLRSLQKLSLDCNRLLEIPPTINNLSNLKEIGVYRAKNIKWPEDLSGLINLTSLSVFGREVNTLPESFKHLKSLKMLDLTNCSLTEVPSVIRYLGCLESLILKGNNIKVVPKWIEELESLKYLNLSRNAIYYLPKEMGHLHNIKYLNLSYMHIHSIPKSIIDLNIPIYNKETKREGIILNNTTIGTQPYSLFFLSRGQINNYYEQKLVNVNEVKVAFLGNGGTGKTFTIRRLLNGGKKIKDELEAKKTEGIEIIRKKYKYKKREITVNYWDFGGQDELFSLHRCFITNRVCYVIVITTRQPDMMGQARYWLRCVSSFAEDSSAILYINLWDADKDYTINDAILKKEFPCLKEIIRCSAKNDSSRKLKVLQDVILQEASHMDSCDLSLPVDWNNIRLALHDTLENGKYYITGKEYERLCIKNNVKNIEVQDWLLKWFNDFGTCFSNNYGITESFIVANSKWITNALYIILIFGRDLADEGIISKSNIYKILQEKKGVHKDIKPYKEEQADHIIAILKQFNLLYPIVDYRTKRIENVFIPLLCCAKGEQRCLDAEKRQIRYIHKYEHMPESVLQRLMVKCCEFGYKLDNCSRYGFCLTQTIFSIVLEVTLGANDTIVIDIYTEPANKAAYTILHWINNQIEIINNTFGIESMEYVITNDKWNEQISVIGLQRRIERGETTYQGDYDDYPIDLLLGTDVQGNQKEYDERKQDVNQCIIDFIDKINDMYTKIEDVSGNMHDFKKEFSDFKKSQREDFVDVINEICCSKEIEKYLDKKQISKLQKMLSASEFEEFFSVIGDWSNLVTVIQFCIQFLQVFNIIPNLSL